MTATAYKIKSQNLFINLYDYGCVLLNVYFINQYSTLSKSIIKYEILKIRIHVSLVHSSKEWLMSKYSAILHFDRVSFINIILIILNITSNLFLWMHADKTFETIFYNNCRRFVKWKFCRSYFETDLWYKIQLLIFQKYLYLYFIESNIIRIKLRCKQHFSMTWSHFFFVNSSKSIIEKLWLLDLIV